MDQSSSPFSEDWDRSGRPSEKTIPDAIQVASLLDLSGTKAAVLQKRAEIKDYFELAAILQHGIQLPSMLAADRFICGRKFNPLITLKALSQTALVRSRCKRRSGKPAVTLALCAPFLKNRNSSR